MISKYILSIKNLEPLNKFKYETEKWKNLNVDFKKYISYFENLKISRLDIFNSFKNYYLGNIGWEQPSLLTMV